MRVMLTTDCVGGAWTFAQELTQFLLGSGNEVALIIVGPHPSHDQMNWLGALRARWGQRAQWRTCACALEWMSDNGSAYTACEDPLLDFAAEFVPDVVHFGQFCFGALPVDCPKLITAHSDVLSWADACRPRGLESSAWLAQYEELVANGLAAADAVVAPTRWMLKALRQNFSLPQDAAVIQNGRDVLSSGGFVTKKLQAVSVGRLWDEAKNIGMLAELDSPMPFLLAGEPGRDEKGMEGVERLGPQNQEAVLKLFCESSVYVVTSVYEPFGLAAVEAALCGCAVLAYDIPSQREVWGDGALYFISRAELARLLYELVLSPHWLAVARERSLQRAKMFPVRKMGEAYMSLYQKLVERKRLGESTCLEPRAEDLVAYVS